jgi:hypothetical protein
LLFRIGSALALVLVLAGCSKGGQFDPTELFNSDTFDSKKKLTGDRQPIFPDGVPGTTTGVPADLVKGYQAPPEQSDASAAPAPEAQKPKPKLASKPKPKPKLAAAPPQPPQGQDSVWNQTPATPATSVPTRISVGPKPVAPGQQADPSQSIWPAPPQTAPAQQTAQPAQSIWPDPPAPGKSSQ